MTKYQPLHDQLKSIEQSEWETSFSEIEVLLGFSLPPSARTQRAWWANTATSQGSSWVSAGWKTSGVNIDAERLTFIPGVPSIRAQRRLQGLTIDEAKAGIAARMGLQPNQVAIQINC